MAKMTIAMGMAQSAKLAYYEDIMDEAIDASEVSFIITVHEGMPTY